MTTFASAWLEGFKPLRVALCAALLVLALPATAQQSAPPPDPAPPAAQPAPERAPGLLENLGRWMDEAGAGMRRGWDNTWRGMGGLGDQAGSAARGAADATANVAKGTVDATKGTIDTIGRWSGTRVVTGRERCAVAPNGAPDCRTAAEAMCKAKGFTTGSSVDYQTAENCPAQAFFGGRKPATGECPIEHVVTKAMCQ